MNAKFYDHAMNQTNPARAEAIARARRELIAEGRACYVEANWKGGDRFYWNGDGHTALSLAKELVFNGAESVIFRASDGHEIDADGIRNARY